ncbi:MAG: adenylosuccinate synthase [Bdellovibrionales bacterium]|jgi:adenylosuccinate synthase|nr:adenylosuccinate synthase [Bdellovibrionales bacterium]
MAGIIVVGAQWGDEGKGKVVDVFSSHADLVVRYQGGANAGHTLVVNGVKTVLHLIPSGVLHQKCSCMIAPGVVLDVEEVIKEIRDLKEAGVLTTPEQLRISDQCTILLSYHRKLDAAREVKAGNEKIGTTGKGIGPAYEDRASRKAVLFGDLFDRERLKQKLEASLEEKNFMLKHYFQQDIVEIEPLYERLLELAKELEPYRSKDTSLVIHKALKAGKKVLFEGAQGTMLDLLHGTYPFVTSSSTISGSACIGTGIGPGVMQKIVGITKAYTTRVGSGPFPTEADEDLSERLRREGGEFGATTGRPRRCGWLDLVALKYAIRVNGLTSLALMKLDVLSGHDKIEVCTAYRLDGQEIKDLPVNSSDLARVEPIYRTLPGWNEDLRNVRSIQDLPQAARDFIQFVATEVATPIDVVSVGPGREQTLWIKPLFS